MAKDLGTIEHQVGSLVADLQYLQQVGGIGSITIRHIPASLNGRTGVAIDIDSRTFAAGGLLQALQAAVKGTR